MGEVSGRVGKVDGWLGAGGPRCDLQKWQCVEDATGTLKLHKCKGPARPSGKALSNLVPKYYGQGGEACTCDSGGDDQLSPAGRRRKFFKSECWRFFKARGEGLRLGSPIRSFK